MLALEFAMYAAVLLVCGAAMILGRRPERLTAAIMLVAFAVNFAPGWGSLLTGHEIAYYSPGTSLTIDIVQLAAMMVVALAHRPTWTLFAAAFQLLATLISFIRLTESTLGTTAYVTAQNTLWWLTMVALAFGVWNAAMHRRAPPPAGAATHS
jgi:hypothetical protein